MDFTHIKDGKPQQVDISDKPTSQRRAVAEGYIDLRSKTVEAIKRNAVAKGDVLNTATIAAVLAAKKTAELIPLCHPIPVTSIQMDYAILESTVKAKCEVKSESKTGVEMEALTGVSVALLTIWDMVKSMEKDPTGNYPVTRLRDIRVLEKTKTER
jgi:cyclic pyranopterin monophosphate synthase